MSVKKEYETVTHTITERVVVKETTCCDVCGKEIDIKKPYWTLATHHSDWGNDSIDSYESYDICSGECLRKKFEEYIEESGNGVNTMCFDVERQ